MERGLRVAVMHRGKGLLYEVMIRMQHNQLSSQSMRDSDLMPP